MADSVADLADAVGPSAPGSGKAKRDGAQQHLGAVASAVLITLRTDDDWRQVEHVRHDDRRAEPGPAIIALLWEPTPGGYTEALRMGADGAVAWEADPAEIAEVTAAALWGRVLMPANVARRLMPTGPRSGAPDWVTPDETTWMRQLASGMKINEAAEANGYSERAMYRLLNGLYTRMGVSSRSEAVVQAERWGLLN